MCKFVAVNRVGKPCALVAHARFEMGAVDLEFLRSAAYLIIIRTVLVLSCPDPGVHNQTGRGDRTAAGFFTAFF